MLVVCVLVTLVTAVAYATLALAKRSWSAASARANVSVNCEVAIERVRRDLQESTADGITVGQMVPALSMRSARDGSGAFHTDNAGRPCWQGFVLYYLDAGGGILRRRMVGGDATAALTEAQLASYADGTGSVVAYDVAALSAVLSDGQLSLTVTCSDAGPGQAASTTLGTSCLVRN